MSDLSVNQPGPGLASVSARDTVDSPGILFQAMKPKWDLVDALCSDTSGIRRQAKEYLPQEPGEEDSSWQLRRDRSFLLGAYKATVRNTAARPFRSPLELEGELPSSLEALLEDADMEGTSLNGFFQDVYRTGVNHGVTYVLIDSPSFSVDDAAATQEDVKEGRLHPYFVHIPATRIIGWTETKTQFGRPDLEEVRISDFKIVQDGRWKQKIVDVVHVWRKDVKETWIRDRGTGATPTSGGMAGSKDWEMESSVPNDLGIIPIVSWYTNRLGFMQAEPPLIDLAWLNLAHFQTWSDKREILRFAALGLLFGSGLDGESLPEDLALKQHKIIHGPEGSKLSVVEGSGASLGSVEREIEFLVEEMEREGMNPNANNPGMRTATGEDIQDIREGSLLEAWNRTFRQLVWQCFEIASMYTTDEIPEETQVRFAEETKKEASPTEAGRVLLDQRKLPQPLLTIETTLLELQRQGLLSTEVDVDDEVELVMAETENLFTAGADLVDGLSSTNTDEVANSPETEPPGTAEAEDEDDDDEEEDS